MFCTERIAQVSSGEDILTRRVSTFSGNPTWKKIGADGATVAKKIPKVTKIRNENILKNKFLSIGLLVRLYAYWRSVWTYFFIYFSTKYELRNNLDAYSLIFERPHLNSGVNFCPHFPICLRESLSIFNDLRKSSVQTRINQLASKHV